ncbi:hypothetical protein ACHAQH_009377 [Verticillium albo-atrum]
MDPARLQTTVEAMLHGYIIPTILPALPSPTIISCDSQQIFLAIWQAFPFWVSVSHLILATGARMFRFVSQPDDASPAATIESLRRVYRATLKYTCLIHFGILALAVFPQLRPAVHGGSFYGRIGLLDMFVPSSSIWPKHIETMAEGSLKLLQYNLYCAGGAISILVSYMAYSINGPDMAAGLKTAGGLLRRSVVAGPGGAVLWALWDRDEEAAAAR